MNTMLVCVIVVGLLALSGCAAWAAEPVATRPVGKPAYYYPLPPAEKPEVVEVDVCVYGATPGGITAAIQAQRMGKSAALLEFGTHVGGMTASGLSHTDGGKTAGGLAAEFYKVVGKSDFTPAAAEAQFLAMLRKEGVKLYFEQRLASVTKDGARVREIAMENGSRFRAKMFVDATYEGDLMAMAKVSYTVGREANSQYKETIDGVQVHNGHQFRFDVDPYVTPGDATSDVLPGVTTAATDAPGRMGDGDKHVQAYNFRMFLAKLPDATPWPKPEGYDPKRYEILRRYITAGATGGGPELRDFMQLHKGDSNNNGAFSTDHIGGSDKWPEAAYVEREKIFQDHVTYQQGLMYFLANDAGVPKEIRDAVSGWGLAKGNFTDTGGWPWQLYVREGRRMVSDYVMTEHNCRSTMVAEDSVGLGEYNMDSHNCQRFIERKGGKAVLRNEGDVQVRVPHPYPISYRAIVPKENECGNLVVPVSLSSTHIAYGSIRMEPVFMVLGQAAGTAACMAIDGGSSVQQVEYRKLRERLLADGLRLDWEGGASTKDTKDTKKSGS